MSCGGPMGTDQAGQHAAERLSLVAATAFIYRQVMGEAPPAADVAEMNELMARVAHALSNVAPIYGMDEASGERLQIPPFDLLHARFERGANRLVSTTGRQYRDLS